jgi:signal peptidase II
MKRYYAFTILILISDLVTKWIVRTRMDLHESIDIIPDYLRLAYVRNTGVAFGLFADFQSDWKPYVLAGMAIVAVGVIVVYSLHMPGERKLLHLALAITMGGILGNFIDRIMHGFVVDFIEFHVYEMFHWPTFNLADSAITVGIGLLLIDTVKNPDFQEAELGRG